MSWAFVFRVREYLRGSLWVLPVLGGVAGFLLAELDHRIERSVDVPEAWQYSQATATSALTAIVGATVALLGFVVTISVLVVQMATGSLSPRFMRLWYRDRLQKVVLAGFTGTFAYAYGLLRGVDTNSVPNIGVTVAGAAVGMSLLLLLLYLDRFAHGLRPVAVAAQVARAGRRVIAAAAAEQSTPDGDDGPARWGGPPLLTVRADRSGTIQAVHRRGLAAAAQQDDCLLVLPRGVGDFVPQGSPLVHVHGSGRAPSGRRLRGMIALGRERTIQQDPAFALRILVDIAIRALSPAVNDPTTASQVINYVEDLVEAIGSADVGAPWDVRDDEDRVRVVLPSRRWEDYLQLAVVEIRDYGATSPQTCRRLRAMLVDLLDTVRTDYRPALQVQIAALDAATARSFDDPAERAFAGGCDRQGMGGATFTRVRVDGAQEPSRP